MIKRTIDISTGPTWLSLKNKQMKLQQGEKQHSIPIEDIGVLICEHPAITISQQLVIKLLENNTVIVWCDAHHHPFGILHPLHSNSLPGQRLGAQVKLRERLKNRLWQKIVRAKIENQGKVLRQLFDSDHGLSAMTGRVKSGDPSNTEARAARAYWKALFGKVEFKRDREGGHVNPLLNYGYTVMRAACCRALVGTGLHPGIGLNHSNQYNPLPLADDVMEPLRPVVDHCVYELSEGGTAVPEMDKNTRASILELLAADVQLDGKKYPLMEGLSMYAASLSKAMLTGKVELIIPET